MPIVPYEPTPQYKEREVKLPPSWRQHLAGAWHRARGKVKYRNHSPKVVSIIGMGPSLTDFFNETLTQELTTDWCDEVWAINMAANAVRHDMVIWMDDLQQQQAFKPGLFDLLRRNGKPVLTSKAYPDIVESYDYPVSEVANISIPFFGKPYLGNGVAMAIGYALWKGVQKIKLYGCDFTYPDRNFAESGRACVEAWIALACVRGVQVALPPLTSLFDRHGDQGIYGYAEQPEILLPDGRKFKYERRAHDKRFGNYVAEDSSGVKNGELRPSDGGTPNGAGPAGTGDSIAAHRGADGLLKDQSILQAAAAASPDRQGVGYPGQA